MRELGAIKSYNANPARPEQGMQTAPINIFLCSLLVALTICAPQAVAIEINPPIVVMSSSDASVEVNLSVNGKPVAAAAIGPVRLLASGHNYTHMMRIERFDGKLRMTPTSSAEIGTYDLEVVVDGARASAQVQVTLDDEPNSLANRAREQGLTEMDIRHQLGLYTEGPQSVKIELPEWYYLGKQVRLNVPTPADASYQWYVNGQLEHSGSGPHTFVYPLTEPVSYEFQYIETHPDGVTIESRAQTEAREEPPVPIAVDRSRAVHLVGPPDYSGYIWLINGEFHSEDAAFIHRFSEAGQYRVECIATGNDAMTDEAFRKVLFLVSVQ
jgi:hypothetical protein